MSNSFEITKELTLPGPPLVTWYAITTAQGLAGWYMPIPPQQDSPMVTTWIVNERLTMRIPLGPNGAFQGFDYAIADLGDDSVQFRFSHFGELDWSDEERSMTEAAWDQYLFTLHKFLTRYLERIPAYIEAEGPAKKVGPNSWASLHRELGLGPTPTVGDAVTIERPGLEAISGVVDYATDSFLGIEAPDTLIRFHGRWPIGLPLAVVHHHYLDPSNPTYDVQGQRAAWTTWLESL